MPVVTSKVNLVSLNRGADLYFSGENVFVPFGSFTAKALPETLDRLAADVVTIEYRTVADPKAREQDRKKYTKRLEGLGGSWVRSEWVPKVIRGYVLDAVMECTITRVV